MNCYNHRETPALGICKACNKALCAECATDLGHGLACKESHEETVEIYNFIIQKNANVYKNVGKNSVVAPLFYLFMGLTFAGFGIFADDSIRAFPVVMGLGFVGFSIVCFVRNKATFSENET